MLKILVAVADSRNYKMAHCIFFYTPEIRLLPTTQVTCGVGNGQNSLKQPPVWLHLLK